MNRVFIVANIRYDDNESFGPHTTWRFAPAFIVPVTEMKRKFHVRHRVQGADFDPIVCELSGIQFGRQSQPPTGDQQRNSCLGFEQPLLLDRVAFGATYFHNDIDNLIVGTFDPVTFISSFANVGQATTQGVEAFASGILSSRLTLG